jgi:hypothetical protein
MMENILEHSYEDIYNKINTIREQTVIRMALEAYDKQNGNGT